VEELRKGGNFEEETRQTLDEATVDEIRGELRGSSSCSVGMTPRTRLMRILVTNDDGYLALGIRALAQAAAEIGDVHVVAPDREQSATSHSLTMHHPLRVREVRDAQVVDGTPTDCVVLAVGELMEGRPDIVFSGINHGANLGDDVLYSGTVAGAMEATILGIPAVALSYAGGTRRPSRPGSPP
jgi:5'-nucleotidase